MTGPSANPQPSLLIRDLGHAYREGERTREVLHGVNLEAFAGECIALVGRSGSGKSTLLNLVSGIETPLAGRVVVNGRDLTRMNERERTLFRRRHIGFVYQFFNLLPTLTVLENLLLPLELNRRDHGRARTLLAEVGLADRAGAFPDRLSGGEQQRVAIARALVHEPCLVLADEPTGNLDADTGRRILDLLINLVRRNSGLLLIVTHAREVAASADRILVLKDGMLSQGDSGAGW
jgi:putative ABC transport system ATP-binding protein